MIPSIRAQAKRPHLIRFLRIALLGVFALGLMGVGFLGTSALQARSANAGAPVSDLAEAAKALGRPLPEPGVLPVGMSRHALVVDPAGTPRRTVSVGYKATGLTLVQVTMFRGTIVSNDVGETVQLGTFDVHVTQHSTPNGDYVGYTWNRDGIAYNVGALLREGLTRGLADQLVASIR